MTFRKQTSLVALSLALPLAMTACSSSGGGGGEPVESPAPPPPVVEPELDVRAEDVLLDAGGLGEFGSMEGAWRVVDMEMLLDPEPFGDRDPKMLEIGDELVVANGEITMLAGDPANAPEMPAGATAEQHYYLNRAEGNVMTYAIGRSFTDAAEFDEGLEEAGMVVGTVTEMHAKARILKRWTVLGWANDEIERNTVEQRAYDVVLERKLEDGQSAKFGPAEGATAGDAFLDAAPNYRVTKVVIRSGWWVDAIQTYWGGTASDQHGGNGGDESVIELEQGEYITALLGSHDGAPGTAPTHVNSLIIRTNVREYGSFGDASGTPFTFEVPEGYEISGFHGTSADFLNSVGVMYRELTQTFGPNTPHSMGAQGSTTSGDGFQDNAPAQRVTKLVIRSGWWLDSIQTFWADGTASDQHGGNGGDATVIELEADEFLRSFDCWVSGDVVRAISIETNLRNIGPIGTVEGEHVHLGVEDGYEVSGFLGTSSQFLNSLGLMIREQL